MLLVGPPGVGKTFAVKAVEAMCADICKVATTYEAAILNSSLYYLLFIDSNSDTNI